LTSPIVPSAQELPIMVDYKTEKLSAQFRF